MVEQTPIYLQPAFVAFVLGTVISGVGASITFTVWLIRQEAKIATQGEKVIQLQVELTEAQREIRAHKEKDQLHFNPAVASQVEQKQDSRMSRIEADVKETKDLVNKLLMAVMEQKK